MLNYQEMRVINYFILTLFHFANIKINIQIARGYDTGGVTSDVVQVQQRDTIYPPSKGSKQLPTQRLQKGVSFLSCSLRIVIIQNAAMCIMQPMSNRIYNT